MAGRSTNKATAPAEPSAQTPKQETENDLKARLRRQAERKVVKDHPSELHAEIGRLFEENGLTYEPPLTAEEKAAKQIEELLEANPGLRNKYAGLGPVAGAVANGDEVESSPVIAGTNVVE